MSLEIQNRTKNNGDSIYSYKLPHLQNPGYLCSKYGN